MRPYSHHKQSGWFDRANEDDGQFSRALLGSGLGGLAGAGLGGLGGLVKETFFTKPEKAQYLRRALQGALLGGLGGAGIGAGIGASNWALDRHDDLRDRIYDNIQELRRQARLGMATEFNAMNSAITGLPFGIPAPQIDLQKIQKGIAEDPRDLPRPEFRNKASNYLRKLL